MAIATSSSVNPPSGPTASAAFSPGSGPSADRLPALAADVPPTGTPPSRLSTRNCLPRLGLGNLHQPIPPTLLGCLDDPAAQPLQGILHGLGHAALGFQRHEPRDAQLDHLLDEPLLPIALGQRHAQGHGNRRLAVNFLAAGNCQFDFAATGPLDDGIELPARAIKERDAGPRPWPASRAADDGPRRRQGRRGRTRQAIRQSSDRTCAVREEEDDNFVPSILAIGQTSTGRAISRDPLSGLANWSRVLAMPNRVMTELSIARS